MSFQSWGLSFMDWTLVAATNAMLPRSDVLVVQAAFSAPPVIDHADVLTHCLLRCTIPCDGPGVSGAVRALAVGLSYPLSRGGWIGTGSELISLEGTVCPVFLVLTLISTDLAETE